MRFSIWSREQVSGLIVSLWLSIHNYLAFSSIQEILQESVKNANSVLSRSMSKHISLASWSSHCNTSFESLRACLHIVFQIASVAIGIFFICRSMVANRHFWRIIWITLSRKLLLMEDLVFSWWVESLRVESLFSSFLLYRNRRNYNKDEWAIEVIAWE